MKALGIVLCLLGAAVLSSCRSSTVQDSILPPCAEPCKRAIVKYDGDADVIELDLADKGIEWTGPSGKKLKIEVINNRKNGLKNDLKNPECEGNVCRLNELPEPIGQTGFWKYVTKFDSETKKDPFIIRRDP